MKEATHLALLRGINVGRAKRVAMADLRAIVEDLGFTSVKTVLNSGNVLFAAEKRISAKPTAEAIQKAVATRTGVDAKVTVLTVAELAEAVTGNPLAKIATEQRRLQVAILDGARTAFALRPLLAETWKPEALAVAGRFAWMWCPDGVIASRLYKAVDRAAGDLATVRNLATLTRLRGVASA